jgi:excisionase family DNA binding protein
MAAVPVSAVVVRYPIMQGDEMLTVAEVADLFKLNPQTLRNWIDRGELPCVRVGRRVRIRWRDMEAFMEPAGPATPGAWPARPSTQAQGFWDAS